MVVRFWSARTTQLRMPEYLRHFERNVLPRLRGVKGFMEARVLSQSDGVVVKFMTGVAHGWLDGVLNGIPRSTGVPFDNW